MDNAFLQRDFVRSREIVISGSICARKSIPTATKEKKNRRTLIARIHRAGMGVYCVSGRRNENSRVRDARENRQFKFCEMTREPEEIRLHGKKDIKFRYLPFAKSEFIRGELGNLLSAMSLLQHNGSNCKCIIAIYNTVSNISSEVTEGIS